jgi:hypothetical protein
MNKKSLIAAAVSAVVVSNAQIVVFTGFNSDGNDNIAFFTTSALSGSAVIRFTDNSWNGSAIGSGGAFVGTESRWSWTAPAGGLSAGAIVLIDNLGTGTLSANTGTVSFQLQNNRGLSATTDAVYAYLGADNAPTSFIGYIANDTAANAGSIANTGLAVGSSAFLLTASTDIGAYTGSRNNLGSISAYQTQVYTIGNWALQSASGDQSIDLTSPDVPFSQTAFTAVPEPSEYAGLAGAGLIGFALWRRRAARKA